MAASLVQVFIIAALLNSSLSSLRTYYMKRRYIAMDQYLKSGILKLTNGTEYGKYRNKYTTIEAPVGHQVLITFKDIDIHVFRGCRNYVKILDGRDLSAALCDATTPDPYYRSSGSHITVHFHSDGSFESSGFTLAFTAIHTGSCSEEEVHCNNEFCIDKRLSTICYSNCGDESGCLSTQSDTNVDTKPNIAVFSTGFIIFMSIFAGIAGIILLCCFGICVRFCVQKIKERRNTRHSRTHRITTEDTLMMEVDSTPRQTPTAPPSQSPMASRQQHYQTQGYIAELNQDPPTYEEAMNYSRPMSKLGETYSPFTEDPHS